MVIADEKYNKHFRLMVIEGLVCGLVHPIEWMVSYSRCLGIAYSDYSEVNEFTHLVAQELFEVEHMRKAKDSEEIQRWVDNYYKKGESICASK